MIFKTRKHNIDFYITLLNLSRNMFFYKTINLKDVFETRIYLMFMHFSVILIIFKHKKINFPQEIYDSLFHCIENNLRELGFGDVGVNKKMKDLNKIFYDILLKINETEKSFKVNKKLAIKYFVELINSEDNKYKLFDEYFTDFYHFCFEMKPNTMLKGAINFKG